MLMRRTSRRGLGASGAYSFDSPITSVTVGGSVLPSSNVLQAILDSTPFTSTENIVSDNPIAAESASGGSASGSGDYCIEMSDGTSTCFSLWVVALVAGVGIFALAMLSGGRRR